MKWRRQEVREPEVNLTPLIDVVFLLLIFFMVSTTFNRETEISVHLPEATGEPLKSEKPVVEVTVDAKGRYYVNQQELVNTAPDTLRRAMKKAAAGEKSPQVILSADRDARHGAVVEAMDAAAQLGFVNVTIATSKPKRP